MAIARDKKSIWDATRTHLLKRVKVTGLKHYSRHLTVPPTPCDPYSLTGGKWFMSRDPSYVSSDQLLSDVLILFVRIMCSVFCPFLRPDPNVVPSQPFVSIHRGAFGF
ncbi:hypothetical protein V6N13_050948 [Hibiscus sabdariffa]|uniref:Uncharacterized protein n=1 Tax=Hibiscus sabdariffa TaxID=183260 RepID=A0ABR2T260_9ROSI